MQRSLMQPCPEKLPPLTDGTGGDVALTMSAWASQYHHCAARHNGLIKALETPQ